MYMNLYEIIIIILCILYVLFYLKKRFQKEGFHANMNNYKDAKTYDQIYDDFYGFLYDDLFYQEGYYLQMCQIVLKYINHVYNNHLCIGIKHGGHMNQLLKKNMKTLSINKSPAMIRLCKYHYKDNDYRHVDSYETSEYTFDAHTYTHISVIDNELYYIQNLRDFLNHCSTWLILKGYLMIQCYHNKDALKIAFSKYGENSELRYKNMYKGTFHTYENNDLITYIETITDHDESRKNYHTLMYYSKEYIEELASLYQLYLIDTEPITKYESILVFQKL